MQAKSLDGYEIIRKLPDGRFEVINPHGQRLRIAIFSCRTCRAVNVPESKFNQYTRECVACISTRQKAVKEIKDRRHRIEALANADKAWKRRHRMVALAKPSWRDKAAIREIYKQARAKTKATGVPHHVDHHYPIQGDWCCGLHVHQNLRILPIRENSQKCNSHPLEDSPALHAALQELGEAGLARAKLEMLRDAALVQY